MSKKCAAEIKMLSLGRPGPTLVLVDWLLVVIAQNGKKWQETLLWEKKAKPIDQSALLVGSRRDVVIYS
jgi:hypothetical protein